MTPEQTPQLSLEEIAKQCAINLGWDDGAEFNDMIKAFKAGYAASQANTFSEEDMSTIAEQSFEAGKATVGQQVGDWQGLAFELAQAVKILIGDIKSKPNDTRYLKSTKVGANALLKYDEFRFNLTYPATVAPPVSGDEIEKSFQWLAEVNANGVDNKEDHKIIICDGDYYWELDQDGDQPISPAKLSEMFLKRNSATPIKETVTDGVDDWISVKDRLPKAEDTFDEFYNEVLTLQHGRKRPTLMKFWELKDCPFTHHWRPLPKPPKQ